MLQNSLKGGGGFSSLSDELGKLIAEHSDDATVEETHDNPYGWVDVITFMESPYYIGAKLFPWQKIIFKMFYMKTNGNRHLSIKDDPTPKCSNCVWQNNQLNRVGRSPCLTCVHHDEDKRAKDRNEVQGAPMLSPERKEEILSEELDSNFINELQLIERDLPSDSDARSGGSVREQVKSKLGQYCSELILVLGRRSGKALALDTPILTTKGWRTMGNLQIGEKVFGANGQPTTIVAATDVMKNRPCYRISFSNGETIICDAKHEWPIIDKLERKYASRENRDAVPKSMTTEEMADNVHYHRNDDRTENNFAIKIAEPLIYDDPKKLDALIPPYLLGAWLGDGEQHNGYVICHDPEVMMKVCKEGCCVSSLLKQPGRHTVRSLPCGSPLYTVLREMKTKFDKRIPENYKLASISTRLSVLQGLMDTDGHVCPKTGRCEITQVNKKLAQDIFDLCISLGLKTTFLEGDATIYGRFINKKYRVCFTPPHGMKVCRLERKQRHLDEKGERKTDIGRIFITDIEEVDSVPVRCIQVDNEDHTFLAGRHCIPTHNSQMAAWLGLYEIYKLIEMGNPQDELDLVEGALITVLNVAVAEGQAEQAIFSKVRSTIEGSPYFKSKIAPGSLKKQSVKFLTPHDEAVNEELEQQGLPERDGSIQFLSGHSNSSSQVGLNIPVVIIDEMAQMVAKDGSKMSDEELYGQLKNSVWTFPEYKIVAISNPLTRDGKFYELYEDSFEDERLLMFQLPSYVANPSISEEILEKERQAAIRKGNLTEYQMHIEARFVGGASNPLIPPNLIDEAFERGNRMVRLEQGDPRQLYYLHIDPATRSDNYALAIVHVEEDSLRLSDRSANEQIVFVDHVQMWSPDKTQGIPVDIATVEQYIVDLAGRFKIASITSDQWNCLTRDDYVFSDKGVVRVEDLVVGDQLIGAEGHTNSVVALGAGGKQKGYEITTRSGYRVRCNPQHPLLTPDGFMEAREIKEKTRIRTPLHPSLFGNIHMPEEAALAGYIVAEGDVESGFVRFTSSEEEVAEDYRTLSTSVFDECLPEQTRSYDNPNWSDNTVIASGKKDILNLVREDWGIVGLSHDKTVPEFVMQGDKETVSRFLSTLYEGDGSVGMNLQDLNVELNTVSEDLARQVHLLLFAFGVKSSLRYYTNKWFNGKRCPFYRISIRGGNIPIFADEIGFRCERKQELLAECVRLQGDWTVRKCQSKPAIGPQKPKKSRSRCEWDRVESIQEIEVDIINMEVDGDHTYVSGGLLSHNSVSTLQFLQKRGLPARQTTFNPSYVQKIFTNMTELFVQGRIVCYAHGPFVTESVDQLKFLQQKFNRRTFRVEAADGHHDDIPACIAGASYVALTGEMSYAGLPATELVSADWARSGSRDAIAAPGNVRPF